MERDVKERSLMSQSVHITMLGSTIGERSQHGGGRVRKKVEWVGPGKRTRHGERPGDIKRIKQTDWRAKERG